MPPRRARSDGDWLAASAPRPNANAKKKMYGT
jgi:hypothetical protein